MYITKKNCIMKTKFYFSFIIMMALSLSFLNSCKEDDEQETDNDYSSALDYTKSEDATNSTFNLVNDYGIREAGLKSMQDDSVVVTITQDSSSSSGWPRILTLDFGSGVLCADGHTRKGVLQAIFSGPWHPDSVVAGTNIVVTFNNFYVDNVQREGEFVFTYMGDNPPHWEFQAIDAQLIYGDGTFTKWNTTRTTYWIEGSNTPEDRTDDILEFEGATTGTSRAGTDYTVTITNTLRFDNTCVVNNIRGTFVSGTFEIVPDNKPMRTVDFGNGDCDRDATVTINGVTIPFSY